MNLLDLTLRSLRRQKGKKSFLVAAMALSLCTAFALYSFVESQARELESQFDEYGANIVVTPRTDDLTLTYGGVNLAGIVTNVHEIRADDVDRIHTIANSRNIRAVSPKLLGTGEVLVGDDTKKALIVGVDFDEEAKIKAWWSIDGRLPQNDREVILGATAADRLGLKMGSYFALGTADLLVTGILSQTGGQDDMAILAPMAFVEDLLEKRGSVSLVEVSALCSDCPIDELVAQISKVLPGTEVRAVRQVMEQRMQVVRQYGRFAASIFGVLTVMCGLFIFATIAGAVTERRREIGIMRAVGFSGSHIAGVVLSEAFLLGIAAAIIGIAISIPVLMQLIPTLTGNDTPVLDIRLILTALVSAPALAVASSIYPAVKASKFDPIESIAAL